MNEQLTLERLERVIEAAKRDGCNESTLLFITLANGEEVPLKTIWVGGGGDKPRISMGVTSSEDRIKTGMWRVTYWFSNGLRLSEPLDTDNPYVRDEAREAEWLMPFPNTKGDSLVFGLLEALQQSDYAGNLFQYAIVVKIVISKE